MVLKGKLTGLAHLSAHFHIILNQNSIVENRIGAPADVLSVLVLDRSMHDDVIGLPNTRSPAGVDQGRITVVNGPRLTMRIG